MTAPPSSAEIHGALRVIAVAHKHGIDSVTCIGGR